MNELPCARVHGACLCVYVLCVCTYIREERAVLVLNLITKFYYLNFYFHLRKSSSSLDIFPPPLSTLGMTCRGVLSSPSSSMHSNVWSAPADGAPRKYLQNNKIEILKWMWYHTTQYIFEESACLRMPMVHPVVATKLRKTAAKVQSLIRHYENNSSI